MKSSSTKLIQVKAPPELLELARIIGRKPAEILEQYAQDLLRLPGSNGSDERRMAGEYFLRGSIVGWDEKRDLAEDFISISRREYRCLLCKEWVREEHLMYIREVPAFACSTHPLEEVARVVSSRLEGSPA